MFKTSVLKNGVTLITIDMPHLDSVTTLVAVKAGSRYETKRINGLSHFLEHMFFKGSKKYPTTEIISSLVDGMGAINNAATSKEFTYYWVKSASKNLETAVDIMSSMLKEPLFDQDEIEREKGVIHEELRMFRDMPARYVYDLFEELLFGNQPLGWDIGGEEKLISNVSKKDFLDYIASLYNPQKMVLVFAGKLPQNISNIAEKYFSDLPKYKHFSPKPFKKIKQTKAKVAIHYKKTDQANIVLGTLGFDRNDKKRFATEVLATILGGGMSSRLFIQVRERRGLAYRVRADHDSYMDTGVFAIMAGLKLEKLKEGITVIKDELDKIKMDIVSDEELKKAKEMLRGRLAIQSESTNFMAEYAGINYVLDGSIETFEEYLKKIDAVTAEDVREVAKELFKKENYNLQIIGPVRSTKEYEKILNS